MTSFFHSIYSPQKFKVDYRNNTLSAKVKMVISKGTKHGKNITQNHLLKKNVNLF